MCNWLGIILMLYFLLLGCICDAQWCLGLGAYTTVTRHGSGLNDVDYCNK